MTHQPEDHQVAEFADQSASQSLHKQQYGTRRGPAEPPALCSFHYSQYNIYIDIHNIVNAGFLTRDKHMK